MLPTKEKRGKGANCISCTWHALEKSPREKKGLCLCSDKKAEGVSDESTVVLTFQGFHVQIRCRDPYTGCWSPQAEARGRSLEWKIVSVFFHSRSPSHSSSQREADLSHLTVLLIHPYRVLGPIGGICHTLMNPRVEGSIRVSLL